MFPCAVVICHDFGKQLEMEGAEYPEPKDIFRTLLIYNSTTSHMAYYVRGYATNSCK